MNNAARYFLYARKSTDDKTRQIRSIGDQIAEARELAAREKLTIAREFVEKQSAKAPGRPIFNEMLDRIERGEADGIIAWAPDRLTRNPLDAGRLSYLVQIGMIQDLRFPTHTFERSANGKFVLNLLFSQSQLYINSLSENITRGKRQKVKSGIWPQEAPIGYRNDKATRTITPDPITGPLIVKMFELYATGQYGFRELRNLLVEMGLVSPRGHPPAVCKIQHALENPIYYGLIRYKDEFYEGKHKPLITQKLFDECRRVMHTRGRTKSKNQIPFLYRGQIRCDSCGCMITLEQQRQYRYVRCTHGKGSCAQPYLREERLIELIDRSIGLLAISETTAEEILAEVDRRAAIATDTTKSECDKLHAEITACDERLSRLLSVQDRDPGRPDGPGRRDGARIAFPETTVRPSERRPQHPRARPHHHGRPSSDDPRDRPRIQLAT